MVAIADKLAGLIQREFPGARLELQTPDDADRVWGVMAWDRFEGLDHVDRQARLWAVIRQNLTPDEVRHVSAILTMTPAEMSDDEPD